MLFSFFPPRHQILTHWCPKHDNDRDASVGVYLHTNTNTCANLFHAWHNSRRYWRVSPIRPVWDSCHSPVERRLCGWVSPPPVISTFRSGISYPLHFSAFFKWLRHYLISREEFSALLSVINPPTRSLIHTYRDIKRERRMLLCVYVFVCVVFSHLFFYAYSWGLIFQWWFHTKDCTIPNLPTPHFLTSPNVAFIALKSILKMGGLL